MLRILVAPSIKKAVASSSMRTFCQLYKPAELRGSSRRARKAGRFLFANAHPANTCANFTTGCLINARTTARAKGYDAHHTSVVFRSITELNFAACIVMRAALNCMLSRAFPGDWEDFAVRTSTIIGFCLSRSDIMHGVGRKAATKKSASAALS